MIKLGLSAVSLLCFVGVQGSFAQTQAVPQPASPVQTPAPAQHADNSKTIPTTSRVFFAPSGIERQISFITVLNAGCSPVGSTEYRLLSPAQQGTLRFESKDDYPFFAAGNPYEKCNDKKVHGLATFYKSNDTYVGEDTFDVLYLLPNGSATITHVTVIVK